MHLPDPVFPPLLSGHAIKSPQRPFEHACREAGRGRLGAGDLVWSRATGRVECAVVLEPEVALRVALQMNALAQVAAADCLGALLPPAIGVYHRWPDTILVNGAAAGEVRLGAPTHDADAVPDWLVAGMSLRLVHDRIDKEPGELPDETSLDEEGGGGISRTDFLQSYAAHFLTWLNAWQDDGFRPVHDNWMARAEGGGEAPMQIELDGRRQAVHVLGLDDEGGLIVRPEQGAARVLPLIDTVVLCRREAARP
ncbi:MAG: hypothetical protein KJZ80_03215 [Hyphomicrobiaceae bacterium]|nr:hypothetical protein [Hyphomicrobiaceae bacterium]